MEIITKKIKVFNFDELSENAKDKVIYNYIDFLINTTDFENLHKNSKMYKAFKTCEDLQTPWFLGQYIFDYCKKEIIKALKDFKYYENGNFYE